MEYSHSIYYRDRFCLTQAYPNSECFKLIKGDGKILIENGNAFFLANQDNLNNDNIHPELEITDAKGNVRVVTLHLQSWKNNGPTLVETTKHTRFKASKFYYYLHRIGQKVHGRGGYSTYLLCKDGITYYSDKNNLCYASAHGKGVLGRCPTISHPIYHEMIFEDGYGFIRSENIIYFSKDSLRTWQVIYKGKRAIKDSMIWLQDEEALLFSEYTPGVDYQRHHIFKYYPSTGVTRTCITFYTNEEHLEKGLSPYCRHIHCMKRDPFTGEIYIGVGDSDEESAIYRSKDNCETIELVGSGNQNWRTLSFLFTENNILWNTDSGRMPQYLHSVDRSQLSNIPINTEHVIHYPLINSAHWYSLFDDSTGYYIMSSSCEGCHYDKKNRVYAIRIEHGVPTVYNLFEDYSKPNEPFSRYHQLFLLGKDHNNVFWFYDTRRQYYRQFILQE